MLVKHQIVASRLLKQFKKIGWTIEEISAGVFDLYDADGVKSIYTLVDKCITIQHKGRTHLNFSLRGNGSIQYIQHLSVVRLGNSVNYIDFRNGS